MRLPLMRSSFVTHARMGLDRSGWGTPSQIHAFLAYNGGEEDRRKYIESAMLMTGCGMRHACDCFVCRRLRPPLVVELSLYNNNDEPFLRMFPVSPDYIASR